MPKKYSELSGFIKDALIDKKYRNLEWFDEDQQIFRLLHIHKNNKDWPKDYGNIFYDWHNFKIRKGNKSSWNAVYQRLKQALPRCSLIKKIKNTPTKDFYYYFVPDDGGSVDLGLPSHADCENMEIENQVENDITISSAPARSPESGYVSNTEVCNQNDFVDVNKTDYCGNRKDNILSWIQQLDVGDEAVDWESSIDMCNLVESVGDNNIDYSGNRMDNCNLAEFVGEKNTDYSGSSNAYFHMKEILKIPDEKLLEIISDKQIFDGVVTSTEETLTSVNSSAEGKVKKEIGNGLPICLKVSKDALDVALKNMIIAEDGEWILPFPPVTNICNLQNGEMGSRNPSIDSLNLITQA